MKNVIISQNSVEEISCIEKNREVAYVDLKSRKCADELSKIGYGYYPHGEQMEMIQFIINHEKEHGDLTKGGLIRFAIMCFNYGKMIGTREERARRKSKLFGRKRTA